MSITFATTGPRPIPAMHAICGATDAVLGPASTWMEAREKYGAHCPDCDAYGPMLEDPADEGINVSNANGARLLDLLGYGATAELVGDADASDFLGRVLLARALAGPDEGVPAHVMGRGMTECGRRIGYTEERLDQLAALAATAATAGLRIVWS